GAAVLLGGALHAVGEIGLTVEFLHRAQGEHPNDLWLNCHLGAFLLYLKPPRAAEGVGYLRAALALRPDSLGVLLLLGIALRDQGQPPGGIRAFEKAIAVKPNFATAHYHLGNVLQRQDDLPGAIAAFEKAIALKPDIAEAHDKLGSVLQRQGKLPGAIAAFEKAIALKRDFAQAHTSLAE